MVEKLKKIPDESDISLNLESLHIFISKSFREIVRSSSPAPKNTFLISDRFALRPLIYALNQTDEYLILQLTQSGDRLFNAINDKITGEVINEDFPMGENIHFQIDPVKLADAKAADNLVKEFPNVNRLFGGYQEYNAEAQESVLKCKNAGIKVIMITGYHTALREQ